MMRLGEGNEQDAGKPRESGERNELHLLLIMTIS